MALRDQKTLETLKKIIDNNRGYRDTNRNLIDIFDGNLISHLKDHLQNIFSEKTYLELLKFLIPINVLQRIIDKLTKIYQQTVVREVEGGNDSDSELLKWYEENFAINQTMNLANEFFNLTKMTLIEPYLSDGVPKVRPVPSDRFVPVGLDPVDPTKLTHLNIIMGTTRNDKTGETSTIVLTWTKEEFLVWDTEFKIYPDMMQQYGDGTGDGKNPFGRIPYTFINKSLTKILPTQDTDTMAMTLEIPSQLSFLSFGIGYNSFPIIIAKNIPEGKMQRGPNITWYVNDNATTEAKPEVDTVKPEIDIVEVLKFIEAVFSLWLNTKGIRPGSVGALNKENMVSGISKMVDESDTTESRKAQVQYFKKAEQNDLWVLIMQHMHPFWVKQNDIENKALFTSTASVKVLFAEQKPLESRSQIVSGLKAEVDAGFNTRKNAIRKLNPDKTDKELEALIQEIDDERTITVDVEAEPLGDDE